MAGQQEYGATDLEAELPDLRRTLAQLGGNGEAELGPERFLELLRHRAHSGSVSALTHPQEVADLATAIRRELAAG
jgi:diacylglycerol kinase family enzyme